MNHQCSLSSDSLLPEVIPKPNAVYAHKQCAFDECRGLISYERVSGYVLDGSFQSNMFVSPNNSSITAIKGSDTNSIIKSLNNNPSSEDTINNSLLACSSACDEALYNCPAFVIDRSNDKCLKLDRNSQGRSKVFVKNDSMLYFEKICLRVDSDSTQGCSSKIWSFERILGYQLPSQLYAKSIELVQSRRDCEELCLSERTFECASALYNEQTIKCQLSQHRQGIHAKLLPMNNSKISYLENQCFHKTASDCVYDAQKGFKSKYSDLVFHGLSFDACLDHCDKSKRFHCVSVSYNSNERRCLVSSQFPVIINDMNYLETNENYTLFERKCANEQLTPTEQSDTDFPEGSLAVSYHA